MVEFIYGKEYDQQELLKNFRFYFIVVYNEKINYMLTLDWWIQSFTIKFYHLLFTIYY